MASDQLADTDILLQNMKWRDLERMGLLPHELRTSFPSLVHIRLVGHDMDPTRLAYDVVIQAETGFMSMNGHPDRPPARMPVALMDILASHQMRAAVLGGLYQREKTGVGWYAEVSLRLRSYCTRQPRHQCPDQWQDASAPRLVASQHCALRRPSSMRRRTARAGGGKRRPIRGAVSHPWDGRLLSEKAFHTNAARVIHRARLMDALNEASKDWAWKDLHHALHGSRGPAGAVLDVMEALRQPGVEARYVVEEEGLRRLKTAAIHVGGFQAGTDTA